MARLFNDGSADAPKLRVYLNLDNLVGLRSDSIWPGLFGRARDERLAADGFEGVQLTGEGQLVKDSPLGYCGLDRINAPAEADAIAAKHAERGDQCITVHVGWGIEDDDEVDRLVEAVLKASERRGLPIFIETHRATITQDVWRTVRIARRFPEVRFNCDFSHYYCGQELVYGDWNQRLEFMEPIFSRTGFMHGRISSSGFMQVPVGPDPARRPVQAHGASDYLSHFREMWTRAMGGFLRNAAEGDVLIFAPELLAGTYYYARLFPNARGELVEESDRYAEALHLARIARECMKNASQTDSVE
jgi:hypothetical protein